MSLDKLIGQTFNAIATMRTKADTLAIAVSNAMSAHSLLAAEQAAAERELDANAAYQKARSDVHMLRRLQAVLWGKSPVLFLPDGFAGRTNSVKVLMDTVREGNPVPAELLSVPLDEETLKTIQSYAVTVHPMTFEFMTDIYLTPAGNSPREFRFTGNDCMPETVKILGYNFARGPEFAEECNTIVHGYGARDEYVRTIRVESGVRHVLTVIVDVVVYA